MKINDTKTPGLAELNKPERGVKKDRSASGSGSGDVVEISDEALKMRQAIEAAKSAPDIRTGKVESLKEEIGKGVYRISGNRVAEKMLQSAFEK